MFDWKDDLIRIGRALRRNLRFLGVCAAVGLVAGFIYLHLVHFKYSVSVEVVPVQNSAGGGLSSMLGGLSGLAGLAGVSLPGGGSQMDTYKAELISTDVASDMLKRPEIVQHVFANRWDAQMHQWKLHKGLVGSVLRVLLGLPQRQPSPPTITEMQDFLKAQIDIQNGRDDPTIKLSYADTDPTFAKHFLLALHYAADERMRARTITRASKYIDYLNQELTTVTSTEQRQALIQTLSEQERSKMFAGANVAYAADVFTQPVSSLDGAIPKPLTILVQALLLSLAAGALAIILLTRFGHRSVPGYAQRYLA